MISREFIQNGFRNLYIPEPTVEFNLTLENAEKEYNDIFYSFTSKEEYNEFLEFFDEEKDESVYTEGVTDVVRALGEFIKKIFKALRDFIQKIVDKIRDFGFSLKSTEKKVDALLKAHPEIKNEELCKLPNLRFEDMKSLSQLESEYTKCMNMLESGKYPPKSIRGRWEKAKKTFQEDEKKLTVVKVAAVVASVVTIATAIPRIKKAIADSSKASRECNTAKAQQTAERVASKIMTATMDNEPGHLRNNADTWFNANDFRSRQDVLRELSSEYVTLNQTHFTNITSRLKDGVDTIKTALSVKADEIRDRNSSLGRRLNPIPTRGSVDTRKRQDAREFVDAGVRLYQQIKKSPETL